MQSLSETAAGSTVDPILGRAGFVRAGRVALLYRNALLVVGATSLLAAMIVLAMWPIVPHSVLLGWLAGFLTISLIRGLILWGYHRDAQRERNAGRWLRLAVCGSGLAGTAWGIAAVLFFVPEQPHHMLLLTCLYAVVVAVGAQALAPSMSAFVLFASTMILPLMYMLIFAGGDFFNPLGMLGLLYLVVITGFAWNAHRIVLQSINLRFENTELVEDLQRQRALAEAANIGKSRFLAAASHDLRQPLHALGLFHDALEPHVAEAGRPLIERMRQSITALGNLFESLLDISRLDAGVVEVKSEPLLVRTLLDRMCAEFRGDAEVKDIALLVEVGNEVVLADPLILDRIVSNLLSNAIRYTERGSVTLRVATELELVRIDVADTGIGIPDDEIERVFDEYHQLHNPERDRSKGLGLGLAVVRRLCGLCEFQIRVQSVLGAGTTFSIYLPVGDASLLHRTRTPVHSRLGGRVVLVIDDERDVRDGMGGMLERWGCDTILAESAADAVSRLRNGRRLPDVIIADHRLRDGETGIEAIATVRALAGTSLPALLISGDTSPERLQEVDESGLCLLHKPVPPAELRTALHQAIIGRQGMAVQGR